MPENLRNKYLGMRNKNNDGYEMEVIEYETYDNIKVRFLPPYEGILKSKMDHFKDGGIHNPFAPTVSGYGIKGIKYPTRDEMNTKKYALEYLTWCNMLKRSVDKKYEDKFPSYKEVSCDPRWQYYENFYEWMHEQENFEKLKEQNDMNLDKDILIKGNKLYSPDLCTLVPRRINNLLLKSDAIRGQYPMGVHYYPRNKKYGAVEGSRDNQRFLGLCDTIEEAFMKYKEAKEQRIKDMAKEEYEKENITKKCYEALMNYTVEITD